ncbi:hypothetical protein CTA2_2036 [Colletotrichum tanaceti]|uniref:Uncharacterized protein n=1 Tax=Colletotrichum tanaceti TaxID=1306861 RepID=A0A4V6Y9K1_9PEZI|nr:hypothetical protein CTA2_2036 [Colletotrichum tanaceti]TKW57906.1 hypothetical protein CTA1_8350 [Colletotrichum tanaceti]
MMGSHQQTTSRLTQEAGERKRQTRLAGDNKKPAVVPEHQVSETCADSGAPDVALPFVPGVVDLIEQVVDQGLPSTSEADDATAGFSLDASAVWLTDLSDGGSISNMLYDAANPSFFGPGVESDIATAALPSPPPTVDPASVMDCSSLSPPEFPDSYLLPMSDLKVLVPHHPIMDFLPWPDVRDRIINFFSLPDEARPSAARGQLGLVNFAYDLEDSGEGARIWGADPYDESSWEVGQVLFERWWFVFDRKVIERSNKWRRLRGAAALQMRPSSVVDLSETAN